MAPARARQRDAPICNRNFNKPLSCAQHTSRVPIRPNADHFTTSSPLSAFFTQWVCTLAATPPQTAVSPPPIGGIALHGGPTRRRHAARRLRVVQNPHRSQPQVRRVTSKTGAGPLGAKKLARHGPSRSSSATKLAQQATKPQFQAILSAQGELFRACRRRPSSALPISDLAPQVWRAPEGPKCLAAVPVGDVRALP